MAALPATVLADFSYQESTQMTGGAVYNMLKIGGPLTRGARAARISTVAVKGDRMAMTDKDSSTIIDLAAETITEVNLEKKTYTVATFEQIKQAMEKALADAKKNEAKRNKEKQDSNVDMKFKVNAKATGQTKTIEGMNAKELIVTMQLEAKDKDSGQSGATTIINDAWMANVKGYDEVKAFHIKMGQKLAGMFDPSQMQMMATQPEMVQGLAQAAKEMAKVDGVPVSSVMKMGAGDPEELAKAGDKKEDDKDKPKAGAVVGNAAASAVAGRFGIGRKPAEEKKEDKKADDKSAPQAALLVEMTTQLSQFSTSAIDASRFAVPAGFKQVDSDIAKRAK
jgi:hypothetical protein